LEVSTVDLSGSSALARSSLGLVTLKNTNTHFVSAMNAKCYEKCMCAYPNELWALFDFLFTALTHALVPAWLTSCTFASSGMNAQKIYMKDDKLSEL
jgi:hypothetical protein